MFPRYLLTAPNFTVGWSFWQRRHLTFCLPPLDYPLPPPPDPSSFDVTDPFVSYSLWLEWYWYMLYFPTTPPPSEKNPNDKSIVIIGESPYFCYGFPPHESTPGSPIKVTLCITLNCPPPPQSPPRPPLHSSHCYLPRAVSIILIVTPCTTPALHSLLSGVYDSRLKSNDVHISI